MTTLPERPAEHGSGERLADMTGLTPLSATTMCPEPSHVYDRLRERYGPVAPVQLAPADPAVPGGRDVNAWLLIGYRELLDVVRRERMYSRDPSNWRDWNDGQVTAESPLAPIMAPRDNAYFKDGPEHRRLIAPVLESLTRVDHIRMTDAVRARCEELIRGFAGNGRAELYREYAAPIPLMAISDLLGLGDDDGRRLVWAMAALFGSAEEAVEGDHALDEIFGGAIRTRRADPADDLITFFCRHENLENDFEVQQTIFMMLLAGWETTTAWIVQTLRLMLDDPRFFGQMRTGRMGVDEALDELLWSNPPMTNMPARFAMADHEIGGHTISKGDALILGLGAANHDPHIRTGDPRHDTGNRAHLAFAAGVHHCPARAVARLIASTAVDTALRLLPAMRLAVPAEELELEFSPWVRRLATLPVSFPASNSV